MSARDSLSVETGSEEVYGWAKVELRWRPGHASHALRALARAVLDALIEARAVDRGER